MIGSTLNGWWHRHEPHGLALTSMARQKGIVRNSDLSKVDNGFFLVPQTYNMYVVPSYTGMVGSYNVWTQGFRAHLAVKARLSNEVCSRRT